VTSAVPRHRGLTPEERERLCAHVAPFPRTLALYTMAVQLGLGAEKLSRLNLGDVTPDGKNIQIVTALGGVPKTGQAPDSIVTSALVRFLGVRCSCEHFSRPLKTYRDDRGIQRCHVCHDDIRLALNPLFVSRRFKRLSPRWVREEFAEHRNALGLDPRLTFDSLRLSTEAALR
jgi:hypothetical protein